MKENTRNLILRNSLDLFNRYGYSNVSVREIADACGIAVGNLTYYFRQKEDIARELMDTPDYTNLQVIDSFHDYFFTLTDLMLDALRSKSFFFSQEQIAVQNDSFYTNYQEAIRAIRDFLFRNYAALRDAGLIRIRNDEEIDIICTITMALHKTWNQELYSKRENDRMSVDTLKLLIWHFLEKYVAEEHMDEYNSVYKELTK